MKKLGLGILFLWVLVGSVSAAPVINSVSGNFSEMENVTIQGGGFGAKENAEPILFDNLEDGATDIIATIGTWTQVLSDLTASTTQKHSGIYSAENYIPSDGYGRFMKTLNPGLEEGSRLYLSMWRRRSEDITANCNGLSSDTCINQKQWRFYPVGINYPNLVMSTSTSPQGVVVVESSSNSGCWGASGNNFRASLKEDEWQFEEVEVQLSSGLDQSDGIFRYSLDGITLLNYTDVITHCTGHEDLIAQCVFDNQGGLGGYIWMDDLYLDITWARIELGNNQDFSLCTHREIQIPQTWSDGSITFQFNQGSFSGGETAYVFVIDENGTASEGYQINISGEFTPPEYNETCGNSYCNATAGENCTTCSEDCGNCTTTYPAPHVQDYITLQEMLGSIEDYKRGLTPIEQVVANIKKFIWG